MALRILWSPGICGGLGEGLAAEHEGKTAVQTTQVAEIGGVIVVGVLPAEGEEGSSLPCRFLHGTAGFFIAPLYRTVWAFWANLV